MTKTAENYAKEKAELERQVAHLAKQNAAIDKTFNMAFNVGLAAGSYEASAALTISMGRIHAMRVLAGEKGLSPGLKSVLDDLERNWDHFGKLADQALKGEKVELKFTSQIVEMHKSLKDERPSTGFSALKEGEDD